RMSCSSESDSSRASVRARACPRARSSSECDTELSQPAEDECGDHRPLSHRRGYALRRAVTHVARSEEPDAARLEGKRIAIERPAVGRLVVFQEILSGQDVAGGIGEDVLTRAPLRVWATADAEEDTVDRASLGLA